jgi:hypothetical protein
MTASRTLCGALSAAVLVVAAGAAAQDPADHAPSEHGEHAEHSEHAEHAEHGDQVAHDAHAEHVGEVDRGAHAEHAAHEPGAHDAQGTQAEGGAHDAHAGHAAAMRGALGDYAMTREASGTSWQPDTSPVSMRHLRSGTWMLMTEASATAVYTDTTGAGARGNHDAFVASMGMLMAQRAWRRGTAGLRAMLSLDPAGVGDDGYPLLFQTGETADGVTPLIDRQHPHDLFMELAATYSMDLAATASGKHRSAFFYAGLPGEPALGPATYMHRPSGMSNPEAPISHHWLDSTHITFGVLTGGVVLGDVKLEASAFNGREPDEHRYDIETGSLDSWSVRATWNAAPGWSMQASFGAIEDAEELEAGVDADRTTVSATYHSLPGRVAWYTTFAAGRNAKQPGATTDAYLLESQAQWSGGIAVFARAESVEKDELFAEGEPLHGEVFRVRKLGVGVERTLRDLWHGQLAVGVVRDWHFTPRALDAAYGPDPRSWLVYARWSLP